MSISHHRKYIYKIVPATPSSRLPLISASSSNPASTTANPSTETFRLPKDYTIVASQLDTSSGYIHLSTAAQVPVTLSKFFASPGSQRDGIYLLRVALAAILNRDGGNDDGVHQTGQTEPVPAVQLRWESLSNEQGEPWKEGLYPHLYLRDGRLGLNGEEVEEVREVVSLQGEEGWRAAIDRVEGWLV